MFVEQLNFNFGKREKCILFSAYLEVVAGSKMSQQKCENNTNERILCCFSLNYFHADQTK